MNRWLVAVLLCSGCFEDAPPVEDDDAADGMDDEESSSSGDVPADPLDAYGPCDIDSDCPLIPGDMGEAGESPLCVQGTCAIRCAQAAHPDSVCPGYFTTQNHEGIYAMYPKYPILCGGDGYCTISDYEPPYSGCPDGMVNGDVQAVPDLACVWPQD